MDSLGNAKRGSSQNEKVVTSANIIGGIQLPRAHRGSLFSQHNSSGVKPSWADGSKRNSKKRKEASHGGHGGHGGCLKSVMELAKAGVR
jgi:hypothetical protein